METFAPEVGQKAAAILIGGAQKNMGFWRQTRGQTSR